MQRFSVASILFFVRLLSKRLIFTLEKKDTLIAKLKANPNTVTFDDAETLLGYLTYKRCDKGKTSWSRIIIPSDKSKTKILLHKPHPRKELLEYR